MEDPIISAIGSAAEAIISFGLGLGVEDICGYNGNPGSKVSWNERLCDEVYFAVPGYSCAHKDNGVSFPPLFNSIKPTSYCDTKLTPLSYPRTEILPPSYCRLGGFEQNGFVPSQNQ
jgi:hypothetical protein